MDDELVTDTLFLALTRPALWYGIPLEAMLWIAMGSILTLLAAGNPIIALGLGGGMWGAARLITRHDYNQFRILFLFLRTKATAANKQLWRGSSYGPLPAALMKRKGFARV